MSEAAGGMTRGWAISRLPRIQYHSLAGRKRAVRKEFIKHGC
jgi:hypothetical protein